MILAIFNNSFGIDMSMSDALLISLVGFLTVFIILGLLALFVKCLGAFFNSSLAKKLIKSLESKENEDKVSQMISVGEIDLINVSEKDAAIIMAITSYKTGIPLNRLKFNSIKLLEEKK